MNLVYDGRLSDNECACETVIQIKRSNRLSVLNWNKNRNHFCVSQSQSRADFIKEFRILNFSGGNFYLPIKPTVVKRIDIHSIERMKTSKCNLLDSGRRSQTECGRWRIDCSAVHCIHNSSLKICCRFSLVTHDLTLCVQFELWSTNSFGVICLGVSAYVCVDFSVTWNEVHTQILSTHCHHWHHEVLKSDEHT